MTSAPRLARRDVVAQVEKLYGKNREHFLLAFHGTGDEDSFDVAGARVRVLPVGSELELRKRLLDLGQDDRVAFLVPWTVAMPVDLQGRFAKNGRVFRIDREERVKGLFGAADSDDGLRGHPLVEYLLTHHVEGEFTVAGGRLTVDAMWAAWLEKVWGVDAGGELALDVLLGFGAVDGRGAAFVATMEQRGELGVKVRAELLAYLDRRLGPAGSLVWKAWESGRGGAALELAIVAAALAGGGTEAVRLWMRLTAKSVFGAEVPHEALVRLGEVADTALRYVDRRSGQSAVRALVLAADARAQDEALRPFLIASTRLPSAWRGRLDHLGDALAKVAEAPDGAREAARAAVLQLRELAGHELFADAEQTATVHRAEMAVRLAAWLAVRPDREIAPGATPYADVEALAGWYVREGGYLDWARRSARGSGDGAFALGVAAVLAAVDTARQELDRRFARALPAWHEAGRPATQVVPIDQALKRMASDFLAEEDDRRLLVVLMDGMSWAVAAEMLESMGGRPAAAWGPLAWHGIGKNRIGDASYPPVLTNFPTLTEVSRSAFFAGKPMPAGPSPNTNEDPRRWQANRDVLKYCEATDTPRLLLRGEGHTRDGSASDEALSLVADRTRRIVGVVINTVDMSLKSDAAHRHQWNVENVKSLRDLLEKAAEVGRAVLLCSDHGHVPADRLASSGAAMKEGARWRVWQEAGDPVTDYEVGLKAGNGVWAPRGAHGVVLMADDAHRYGGGAGAGEHGGASLAEVVAPCVLIGNSDNPVAGDDSALAVRPVRAPSWWHFDMQAEGAPEVAGEPRPTRKRRITNEGQMTLPAVPVPAEPVVAPPAVPKGRAAVDSPLARSAVLAARVAKAADRERVIVAVEFLRQRNGVAAAAAFAQEMNEFVGRIAGLVSKLQEALNVDGYQVLRFDRQNQQVHLDVAKLAQQFGVKF